MLMKGFVQQAIVALIFSAGCEDESPEECPTTIEGHGTLPCPDGWVEGSAWGKDCLPSDERLAELGATGAGGIVGVVSKMVGNCTPGEGPVDPSCVESRGPRTIRLRVPFDPDLVVAVNRTHPIYCLPGEDATALILEVETNDNGEYLIELEPGTYSVLVALPGCEMCEDAGGNCGVEVVAGEYAVYNPTQDQSYS